MCTVFMGYKSNWGGVAVAQFKRTFPLFDTLEPSRYVAEREEYFALDKKGCELRLEILQESGYMCEETKRALGNWLKENDNA